MIDPNDYQHGNELVTRTAPRWAWSVLDVALSSSIATGGDEETRQKIANAVQAMIEASVGRCGREADEAL